MRKGGGRRSALLAVTVATAALATGASAQAAAVDLVGNPHTSHSFIDIGGWEFGEQNDITVKPSGKVPADDSVDAARFPWVPASVVVTDRTTPLSPRMGNCLQLDPHSVRCIALNGIDEIDADLGDAASGSSFELIPGRSGYATPMTYLLNTRDGDDRVTIPSSRGITGMWTGGGSDAIDVTDPSGVWSDNIKSGPGDDQIKLTTPGSGSVDCGDGIDTAQIVGTTRIFTENCETLTP
jgi:hypothetical protein